MQEKVLTTVKKLHLQGLMFHRTAFFKVVGCRLLVVGCRFLVVGCFVLYYNKHVGARYCLSDSVVV